MFLLQFFFPFFFLFGLDPLALGVTDIFMFFFTCAQSKLIYRAHFITGSFNVLYIKYFETKQHRQRKIKIKNEPKPSHKPIKSQGIILEKNFCSSRNQWNSCIIFEDKDVPKCKHSRFMFSPELKSFGLFQLYLFELNVWWYLFRLFMYDSDGD